MQFPFLEWHRGPWSHILAFQGARPLLVPFLGSGTDISVLRKPPLVKCCHFSASVVLAGEQGGKENFLKVSLLAEKGKLIQLIFQVKFHNCQPNHQAAYPYAFLLEIFYSFSLPDSNSLQGFITFT